MTDIYVNNIIHSLGKVGSGAYRRFEIFNDWLELVETSLTAMPAHLKSVSQHKTFAEDNLEAKQLWARMRKRYQNSPSSWSRNFDYVVTRGSRFRAANRSAFDLKDEYIFLKLS